MFYFFRQLLSLAKRLPSHSVYFLSNLFVSRLQMCCPVSQGKSLPGPGSPIQVCKEFFIQQSFAFQLYLFKFALFTGPPLLNNNNNSLTKSDNGKLKDFTQYEPLFNQVSDERRTINCFELQDLLETCLPNGKVN